MTRYLRVQLSVPTLFEGLGGSLLNISPWTSFQLDIQTISLTHKHCTCINICAVPSKNNNNQKTTLGWYIKQHNSNHFIRSSIISASQHRQVFSRRRKVGPCPIALPEEKKG